MRPTRCWAFGWRCNNVGVKDCPIVTVKFEILRLIDKSTEHGNEDCEISKVIRGFRPFLPPCFDMNSFWDLTQKSLLLYSLIT